MSLSATNVLAVLVEDPLYALELDVGHRLPCALRCPGAFRSCCWTRRSSDVDQQADHADGEHAAHHGGGGHRGLALDHQVAHAAGGDDQLGAHQRLPAQAGGDAQPGHDGRHGGRQQHLRHRTPGTGAEHARGLDVLAVDLKRAPR
jgi:hypothetical protein